MLEGNITTAKKSERPRVRTVMRGRKKIEGETSSGRRAKPVRFETKLSEKMGTEKKRESDAEIRRSTEKTMRDS